MLDHEPATCPMTRPLKNKTHHGSCAFKLMAGTIDKPRKNIQRICEIKFVSCTLVAIIFVVYSCILMGVVTLATTVMVPLMAGLNGGMS